MTGFVFRPCPSSHRPQPLQWSARNLASSRFSGRSPAIETTLLCSMGPSRRLSLPTIFVRHVSAPKGSSDVARNSRASVSKNANISRAAADMGAVNGSRTVHDLPCAVSARAFRFSSPYHKIVGHRAPTTHCRISLQLSKSFSNFMSRSRPCAS